VIFFLLIAANQASFNNQTIVLLSANYFTSLYDVAYWLKLWTFLFIGPSHFLFLILTVLFWFFVFWCNKDSYILLYILTLIIKIKIYRYFWGYLIIVNIRFFKLKGNTIFLYVDLKRRLSNLSDQQNKSYF